MCSASPVKVKRAITLSVKSLVNIYVKKTLFAARRATLCSFGKQFRAHDGHKEMNDDCYFSVKVKLIRAGLLFFRLTNQLVTCQLTLTGRLSLDALFKSSVT